MIWMRRLPQPLKCVRKNKMSKSPSIKKNFIYSTFYQILSLITPLITAPYISRVLGAEGVGIYSYTSSFATYFSMVAALGVASYGNREIAQHRDNIEQRSRLFYEIELLVTCTTLCTSLGWLIFSIAYKKYTIYLSILLIQVLGTAFDISWFFGGLEQYSYIVIKNTICKLASVVLLFVLVKNTEDVWLYILILSGSTAAGNLSTWTYVPRFLIKVDPKTLNIRKHLKETFVYFVPTIATSVYTVLDKTMIGLITDSPIENGYYEQATKIINIAKAIAFTALNSVLSSRISYLFSKNKIKEVKKKIEIALDYILFMGIGISFGIIGISKWFVPWFFGDGYEEVTVLLILFSPIVVIIGVSNCAGSLYYTPAGLRRQSTRYIISGAVINLIMNTILIPGFSCYGAVIGSLIAESTITVLYVYHSNGYFTLRKIASHGWKKMVAGIAMLSVIFLLGYGKIASINVTVTQVILGGGIYCVTLLIIKDSFFQEVLKIFFKRIGRKS